MNRAAVVEDDEHAADAADGMDAPDAVGDAAPQADRRAEIAALFKEHNKVLVRFLRVRVGSESEAHDLAQEAYVRLLQLESRGTIGFLRAYLFKIAENLVYARGRRPFEPKTDDIDDIDDHVDLIGQHGPEQSMMAAQELSFLSSCLQELPPECARAFVLHRVRNLPPPRIALEMQVSERMVRRHVARALLYCQYRLDGAAPELARAEAFK